MSIGMVSNGSNAITLQTSLQKFQKSLLHSSIIKELVCT